MGLHDASSGTLSMEFLYVVAPLPSWQHRDCFVGDAFATKFCPACTHLCWNRSLWYGVFLSVVIGGFGDVPLRENFSGVFVLPRSGGHQLVHRPGLKYS